MNRAAALAAVLILSAPAAAADKPAPPPNKIVSMTVFGDDGCPKSSDDEIVVCQRVPESERYRLPKRFRGRKAAEQSGPGNSWTNKVSTLETASRVGTPNSCSPVGSGGFTGCMNKLLHDWYVDRQARQSDADAVP